MLTNRGTDSTTGASSTHYHPHSSSSSNSSIASSRSGRTSGWWSAFGLGVLVTSLLCVLLISSLHFYHNDAPHEQRFVALQKFQKEESSRPISAATTLSVSPSTSTLSDSPFSHCRPGTQRCVAWSRHTAFTRINLMDRENTRLSEGKKINGASTAVSAHLDDEWSRAAREDVDGKPELYERLAEYTAQHRRDTDIDAMVNGARADHPGTSIKSTEVLRAFEKRLSEKKYIIHVDGESGLGNKLLPLIATFALGLLQNRTMLVHFPNKDVAALFTVGPSQPNQPPLLSSFDGFARKLIDTFRELDPDYTPEKAATHWTSALEHDLNGAPPPAVNTGFPTWRTFKQFVEQRMETIPSNQGAALVHKLFTSGALDMQSPDSGKIKSETLCDDMLHFHQDKQILVVWGDQYYLPILASNPTLRPHLLRLVHETNMYGPLSRWFINWKPEFRLVAQRFANHHFGSYNIGIQLRRREKMAITRQEVLTALLVAKQLAATYQPNAWTETGDLTRADAFYGYELTPSETRREQLKGDARSEAGGQYFRNYNKWTPLSLNLDAIGATPPQAFADLQRANASTQLVQARSTAPRPFVTFFVATDEFGLRERVKRILEPFGHVAFVTSEAESYDASLTGTPGAGYYVQGEKQLPGLHWSVIDNLLLSACDDLIVSPSSTYGNLAHAYASTIPHRIGISPSELVLRAIHSEPPTHFWRPLFREVQLLGVCRNEGDLPAFAQMEECCPRWSQSVESM